MRKALQAARGRTPPPAACCSSAGGAVAISRPPTILIVEDEPVTAMLVERAVRQKGYGVAGPFDTDQSALGAIEAGGLSAALLDVSLKDGATSAPVAAALCEAGVPFAFVTGYGPETGAVAASFPDRLVIPKPVDVETVSMILDELTGQAV